MTKRKTGNRRIRPPKGGSDYHQFWRIVDGAVRDAFQMHPDYLTEKGMRWNTARQSIVKRVVGEVLSHATLVKKVAGGHPVKKSGA